MKKRDMVVDSGAAIFAKLTDTELRLFPRVLDATPASIFVIDNDCNVIEWNPSIERFSGYSQIQAVGKNVIELIFPGKFYDSAKSVIEKGLSGYSPYTELLMLTAEGECIEFFLAVAQLKTEEGDVIGAIGSGVTSTWDNSSNAVNPFRNQLLAEGMQESLAQKASDLAKLGYSLYDREQGRDILVSKNFVEMLGMSEKQYLDNITSIEAYIGLLHPEDWKDYLSWHNAFQEPGHNNQETSWIEYRILRPDGLVRFVQEYVRLDQADDSEFGHEIVVYQDITDKRKIELSLEKTQNILTEKEVLLSRSLKVAGMGYVIWDANTDSYPYVSEEWANVFGFSKDEYKKIYAETRADHILVHPEDLEHYRSWHSAPDQETTKANCEYRVFHRDGGTRHVIETADKLIFENSGNTTWLCTIQDITKIKELEEADRQGKAAEISRQIAGGIAHEFNNIMSVILGCLELLELEVDDSSANDILLTAKKSLDRGTSLTGKLLQYSGKRRLSASVCDANKLVLSSLKHIQGEFGKDVQINCELSEHAAMIDVDAAAFDNALMTLALNAKEAMPSGGVINISVYILSETMQADAGGSVIVEISDSGSGISEGNIENVTIPFFSTKEPAKHSGLGLSMISGFIAQCGASLNIQSQQQRGTTVSMIFNRVADLNTSKSECTAAQISKVRAKNVLLVTDSKAMLKSFPDMLADFGYLILTAPDEVFAKDMMSNFGNKIDMVFIDVRPSNEMNAMEFSQWVSSNYQSIKIMICGDYSGNSELRNNTQQAGCTVLETPYSMSQLVRAINLQ